MEFAKEYQKYELDQLLGYYNLEVSSFILQSEAMKIGLLVTPNSQLLNEYFIQNYKFDLVNFDFSKGVYRLLKYAPDFKSNAHNLLYFEDDIFVFTSIKNNHQVRITGKQIFVGIKIKPQLVNEFLNIQDRYCLTIEGGIEREKLIEYVKQSKFTEEFHKKSSLHENIRMCFLKNPDNIAKIDQVLSQRFKLLNFNKPNFDWAKISKLPQYQRADYLIFNYDLPDFKVIATNDCLQIKQIYNSFYKNISNEVFIKNTNNYLSYSFHIKKFIARLKYQINKTIRVSKP